MTVVKVVWKRGSKQGFAKKKSGRYPSGLIYWLTKWLGLMYNGTSRLFIDQEPLFLPLQMQYTGKKTNWKYQDVDDNDHLEDDDDHVDEDLEGIEAALGGNLASDRILRRAIQIQIRIPTRYRLSHHCYVAILVTFWPSSYFGNVQLFVSANVS